MAGDGWKIAGYFSGTSGKWLEICAHIQTIIFFPSLSLA